MVGLVHAGEGSRSIEEHLRERRVGEEEMERGGGEKKRLKK